MLLNAYEINVEDLIILKDGVRGKKTGLTPLEKLFATDNCKNVKLLLENGDEVEMVQLITMPFGVERYCMLMTTIENKGELKQFPICYKLVVESGELSLIYVKDENAKKMVEYYENLIEDEKVKSENKGGERKRRES